MSNSTQGLKRLAKHLKFELLPLYYAYKDPRVPWYAKLLIVIDVGYVLSPVDLIPDFISVLGYLDDLVLVPLGIAMVIKMIPSQVMEEARQKATKSKNWFAAALIIVICIIFIILVLLKVIR